MLFFVWATAQHLVLQLCLHYTIHHGSVIVLTHNYVKYYLILIIIEGYIKTLDREKTLVKHDMEARRQERRSLWNNIPNLHVVGECVERVRIRCRYAVIIMIHCHLSFQQVMSSIECSSVLGVISLPCCNYFEVQQLFMGQPPSYESILVYLSK